MPTTAYEAWDRENEKRPWKVPAYDRNGKRPRRAPKNHDDCVLADLKVKTRAPAAATGAAAAVSAPAPAPSAPAPAPEPVPDSPPIPSEFASGARFSTDATEWQVKETKMFRPRGGRAWRQFVFFFNPAAHPGGPPSEDDCERMHVVELKARLRAAAASPALSPNFHPTLAARMGAFKLHPLMTEPRAEAWGDDVLGALDDEQRLKVDAVYSTRAECLSSQLKKGPTVVISSEVTVLFGLVASQMEKLLRKVTSKKRPARATDEEYGKKVVEITVLPKLLVWVENLLLMAGFQLVDGKYVAVRRDAVERLLGNHSNHAYINPLVYCKYWSPGELAKFNLTSARKINTDIIDPFEVPASKIYTFGVPELGASARDASDPQKRVYPEYVLRNKLMEKRIGDYSDGSGTPDPRVKAFAFVEPDVCFQIVLKRNVLKPRQPCASFVDVGATMTLTFARRRMVRRTPGWSIPAPEY